jgi:hypothetical protein
VAQAPHRSTIEELLARDVIELTWEILRLRRVKTGVLKASMHEGVERVMDDLGYDETYESSKAWAAGDKRAKEQVTRSLATANLSMDEVTARTLQINLETFERIERLLSGIEVRRNNALREHDRHRSACGAAIRRADAV